MNISAKFKPNFIKYLLVFAALSSISFLVYQYFFTKNSRLNLPYRTDEPVLIAYPQGVKLGHINSVELSSLEDKSLWINGSTTLHLDLANKNVDFFTRKYGILGTWNYWGSNLYKVDSLSRSIWYADGNRTFRMEVDKKETHEYNYVGRFLTLLRQENKIWIGTSQGLFEFDEKSDVLVGVAVVCNVAVKSIQEDGNDLIINDIYKYNKTQNNIGNISYTYIPRFRKILKDAYSTEGEEHKNSYDLYKEEYEVEENAVAKKPVLLYTSKKAQIYSYGSSDNFLVLNNKDTSYLEEGKSGIIGLEDTAYWYINDNKSFAYFNFSNQKTNVFYAETGEHFLPTTERRDENNSFFYDKKMFHFDDRCIWYYYGSQLYCFDRIEKKFGQVYNLGTEHILSLKSYGNNLLILGEYKVIVASKSNLMQRISPLQKEKPKEIPLVYAFKKELSDSLNHKIGILDKIIILETFRAKYSSHADSAIQHELTQLSRFLSFGQYDTLSYMNARSLIDKGVSIKPEYKSVLYQSIIQTSVLRGRVTMATSYYEKMKEENIVSGQYFENEMIYVLKAKKSLDSLRNLGLLEEQTLWGTGKIILKLLENITWNDTGYGESFADKSAAYDFFRQLYTKFPQSDLADDADWEVNGNCLGYDTCGPPSGSEECINYCQSFLKRFPNTNLRKEAYRCIVSNYRYLDGEESFKLKNVRAGIAFAKKALVEFPELKKDDESIYYEMKEMQDALVNLAWELKATLGKESYRKGEPIIVKIALFRNDATPEAGEIEYKTNTPNCHVELFKNAYPDESGANFFRENPYCPEVKFLKKKLFPGQKITEQFDLLKNARVSDYMKDGLFILPTGDYRIKILWENISETDEMNFRIE
jgi:hypothetical protein